MPGLDLAYFSLIIPTYRRPDHLAACLAALSRLDYPRTHFEVIVVDDGGGVPLDEVVQPFQPSLNLTLIHQANAGAAAARNTGARHASGTYLAFVDDDCAVEPGWLRALAHAAGEHPDDLLGGRTINALRHNRYSSAAQRILDLVYAYYNADPQRVTFFASNNIAPSAAAFHALGGFDPRFPGAAAEDRDFCDRWLASGRRLHFVADAVAHHAHALDLPGFWRMYFNYGRGAYRFHRLRAARGTAPIRIDTAFPTAALRHMAHADTPHQRATSLGLFAVWQLANAAGFAHELLATHLSPITDHHPFERLAEA